MKKEINSNNEKLVNKVFEILTKFRDDPKKFENIFTELFEKDFEINEESKSILLTTEGMEFCEKLFILSEQPG